MSIGALQKTANTSRSTARTHGSQSRNIVTGESERMTKEELKKHCLKQVEACEMWAKHNGEEPHGKVYEEHKLILELLEQESMLEKIREEVDFQEKWLMDAGYNAYNVDIAFNSIRSVVKESEE